MISPSQSDDPRDHLVDQGFSAYTEADHDTWRTLARRQRELLQGRIADQFLDGLDRLGIGEAGIPDFREMNRTLRAATGWEVVAVPGLVPDLAFFRLLADRKFPAGFWIRRPDQIDYIEEPDIFHDVFGHVPLIMQPVYADYLEAYGRAGLVAAEHGALKRLARRQRELLQGRIADQFLDGLDRLGIGEAGIPDFREMNRTLRAATGWEVVAVPGLVPDLAFFRLLADRKFPAGFWIRRPDQIDYIEEPDIFHDVFGHVPLIMQPVYADYLEAYGRAGLVAAEHGALKRLARLYWYTVEFGLAQTRDGLRIVGAGIASSPSETIFALESPSPNRLTFHLGRVMRTLYRIDDFQETYFVLDGVESWPSLDLDRLIPLWRELEGQPELEPGDIQPEDQVLARGDGSYHRDKAAGKKTAA